MTILDCYISLNIVQKMLVVLVVVRAVAKSWGARSTGWGECAPPVEIGLTDLPKTGGA